MQCSWTQDCDFADNTSLSKAIKRRQQECDIMCAWTLSHFFPVRLFETLWTIAHQTPLSMHSSGKNTRVGCMPSSRGSSRPRDRTRISCISCIAGIFFTTEPPGKPTIFPAAAAKSLQSCPTLCDPIDGSPPGSPVPGILQARTLEWVAISSFNAWK